VNSDRWKGEIPTYLPMFCDGWQPPAFWLEEIGIPTAAAALPHQPQPQARYWRSGPHEMVVYLCTV